MPPGVDIKCALLVDDEPEILRLGKVSMEAFKGWRVAVSAGAAGLVERVVSERPDVILLDLMMPGIDGLTALAQLREDERTCGVPVVIVSAGDRPEEAVRYRQLGAVGIIAKPFNPRTLGDQVVALLEAA